MADGEGIGSVLSKIFDVINKICAFILVIVYVLFAINANWEFITNETVLEVIGYIMHYGPLVIVSLVCIEFAIKRNIALQIIVYLLLAVMIIFQFLPGTWDQIVGSIKG